MAVPSPPPILGDKMALRRQARERRQAFLAALDDAERARLEAALADVLAPLVANSRVIGGYAPMPTEASPLAALSAATAEGKQVAYPAFADHQSPFRFLVGEPAEVGPFGVLQPSADSPAVYPDLVLLPLVAVDARGHRLGQGKGHYDRVVPDLRRRGALLVGVGWAVQRLDGEIPADPWDQPLDAFASPAGLEWFR